MRSKKKKNSNPAARVDRITALISLITALIKLNCSTEERIMQVSRKAHSCKISSLKQEHENISDCTEYCISDSVKL